MAGPGREKMSQYLAPQFFQGLAITAQVIARRAVESPAVTLKVRLPALAQHLDHHHVLIHRLCRIRPRSSRGPSRLVILSLSS